MQNQALSETRTQPGRAEPPKKEGIYACLQRTLQHLEQLEKMLSSISVQIEPQPCDPSNKPDGQPATMALTARENESTARRCLEMANSIRLQLGVE